MEIREAAIEAATLWGGTRLAFIVITYFTVVFTSQYAMQGLTRHYLPGGVASPHSLLSAWAQWDYNWFSLIAGHGYLQPATAFFPLYPALMHVGYVLFLHLGKSPESALLESGLAVSNLAALIAFTSTWLLIKTASDDKRVTRLTLFFMLAFPFAFFFAAPYTESLFLAAAASALLFARKGHWLPAALAAYVAALVRNTAVVLVLPLLWEFAMQRNWFDLARWRSGWATRGRWAELGLATILGLAVPAAIGTYAIYLLRTFHDPLAFVHAEQIPGWSRQLEPPWQTLRLFGGHLEAQPHLGSSQLLMGFEGLLILVFGVVLVWAARSIPGSFLLYGAGVIALILVTPSTNYVDPFVGVGRYLLLAFPVFYVMAKTLAARATLAGVVLFAGVLLQGFLTSLWLTGAWLA